MSVPAVTDRGQQSYLQQADAEFRVGVLQVGFLLCVRVIGGTSCHMILYCLPFCFGCHGNNRLY